MALAPLAPRDLIAPVAIGFVAFVLLAALSLAPRPGGVVLALFPPWVGAAGAFARAAAAPGWAPIAVRRTWLGATVLLRRTGPDAALPQGMLALRGASGGCFAAPAAGQ